VTARTLAHYQISGKLGAGGMGEVHRATDTKLGRDVALKMVPAAFAQDAERMARFQREAQVLASLNHPSIGAIYGLGEHEGTRFLVLELIEGPTLFDRLAAGRIPQEEAFAIARHVAEAVEFAHENRVLHRDLKPANVKVTGGGRVKVLDFGLAKALGDPASSGSGADPAKSPTLAPTIESAITGALTAPNVILGTAAYTSPEQARGKPLDRRTDIFSFGCVFYEMLTGRRAFEGETVSDVMARILSVSPTGRRFPDPRPTGCAASFVAAWRRTPGSGSATWATSGWPWRRSRKLASPPRERPGRESHGRPARRPGARLPSPGPRRRWPWWWPPRAFFSAEPEAWRSRAESSVSR